MPDADWTIVLSGPLAQRQVVLRTLSDQGIPIEPATEQRGHPYGLPDDDPSVGWVACRHASIERVRELARRDWSLRLHWKTPACRACGGTGRVNHGAEGLGVCLHCEGKGRTNKPLPSPEEQMAATIATLTKRLAALEARG